MKKINLLIVVSLLWLTSCSNDSSSTNSETPTSRTIYVAGYENGTAKIWKNGIPTVIQEGAIIYAMQKVGDDLYLAGNIGNNAVYWKNGVVTILTNSINGANVSVATSIAVFGSDVYVAGSEANAANVRVAKYWKNGVPISITDGNYNASLNKIKVVGSDVYLCGYEATIPGVNGSGEVGKYWKNGVATEVNMASVTDMAIVNNDVHLVGYQNNGGAKYWKNGVIVTLPSSGGSQIARGANSIFIDGTDIYIGGVDNNKAAYWKNGILNLVGSDSSVIRSIYVSGSDVYSGGIILNNPGSSFSEVTLQVWKNATNVPITLESIPTYSAEITSIFVDN